MSDAIRERSIRVQRTARVLEAGGADAAGRKELWYVLHGYAELAREVMDRVAFLATDERRIVVPEALSRFYRRGSSGEIGASWMTREAREDEVADYVAYLDRLHAELASEMPSARVTLIGFSQGSATASRWAGLGNVEVDRLILWGGALPPDLDLEAVRDRLRTLAYVVGERDPFVTDERLARERARVEAAGLPWRCTLFDGAHEMTRDALAAL